MHCLEAIDVKVAFCSVINTYLLPLNLVRTRDQARESFSDFGEKFLPIFHPCLYSLHLNFSLSPEQGEV